MFQNGVCRRIRSTLHGEIDREQTPSGNLPGVRLENHTESLDSFQGALRIGLWRE